jgi:catechol 2,3-dioxygenase-like lactoylglutathione lyase family enzyme
MKFDHLAVSVESIAEALSYYQSRFPQLTVLHEDATWAYIQIDAARIAFVLEEQHPPHLAFRVSTREELERMARGDRVAINLHRDGSESYYLDDPFGNTLEFVYYPVDPAR